jgi:hypothetical protein
MLWPFSFPSAWPIHPPDLALHMTPPSMSSQFQLAPHKMFAFIWNHFQIKRVICNRKMMVWAEGICFHTPSITIHSVSNQLRLQESVLDADLEASQGAWRLNKLNSMCAILKRLHFWKQLKKFYFVIQKMVLRKSYWGNKETWDSIENSV